MNEIQNLGLPLEELIEQNEIITSDGYRDAAINKQKFIFRKRDFLFKNGFFRNEFQPSLLSFSRSQLRGKILVSSHSDYRIDLGRSHLLRSLGLRHVFSTNLRPLAGFSTSLPLGLTNNTDESPIHRILGNHNHLARASNESDISEIYSGSLLINFTVSNSSKNRMPIINLLPQLRHKYEVIQSVPDFSEIGRVNYLKDLRISNLVLCPEGNGIDTHRLWETLYMGGVPVIINSAYMRPLTHDLPVIHLNNWNELLNEEKLARCWQEISKQSWNLEKLKISYWTKLILEN